MDVSQNRRGGEGKSASSRLWHPTCMDLGLADRRLLVAGASRGLGAAIARALAADGARLALVARESDGLRAAAASFAGEAIGVDLSEPDGPATAVRAAVDVLGGLDGLLVNSGGPLPGTFEELDEAAWSKAIAGTLMSSIRLIREALPHLREGRDPAILVILSSSAREPIPGLVTSNVLRPGLAGLVKSLASEIAPIRVNGLAPGRFDTDRVRSLDASRAAKEGTSVDDVKRATIARIPLGRYGDPDELGRIAAFLLAPAASYLTGVILPVDGGMIKSLP
jgi:3-oxoacyl-[acyl-carrier protein] reductase